MKLRIYESNKRLHEQDVDIEVKHEGILEVPEGKNVEDLPFSHFEKLAKKKGLSKITKALNNLQVWNKNNNKSLSKWAGDMIDKLNDKLGKDESVRRRHIRKEAIGRKSYWGYTDPNGFIKRLESSDYPEWTPQNIKKLKLIPFATEEELFAAIDKDTIIWGVYKYDKSSTTWFYGTKEEAYRELMIERNYSIYERKHDL